MSSRVSNKNFYPLSNATRETFCMSNNPILFGNNMSMNDRNLLTRLEVYDRLFTHHTLNSIRRDNRFIFKDMAPNDSLDFALSSIYIHSEDYNVPKNYVPMQPETLNITQNNNMGEKKGKQNRLVKIIESGPKISIITNSSKKSTKKHEKSSDYKGSGGMTLRYQQHNKSTPQKQYEKSSASKRSSSSQSSKRNPKKYPKTASASTRGHDKISFEKKYTIATRNVKSAGAMTGRVHRARDEEIEDDVLDKTQRRESYAAQMRAIERIHPSSLKLAVDGPHSDQTNPGYSRKIDGTFYGI